jgi:hypothetical protein
MYIPTESQVIYGLPYFHGLGEGHLAVQERTMRACDRDTVLFSMDVNWYI